MKYLFLFLPFFASAQTVGLIANRQTKGVFVDRTLEQCGAFAQVGAVLLKAEQSTLAAGLLHVGHAWGEEDALRPLLFFGAGGGINVFKSEGKRVSNWSALTELGAGVRKSRLYLAVSYMTGATYPSDVEGWTLRVGFRL